MTTFRLAGSQCGFAPPMCIDAKVVCFWDGAGIKSSNNKHTKVPGGSRITDPKHNIDSIKSKEVLGKAWWFDAKGQKTKSRGTWRHACDGTAGWGGTIFWQYNADFGTASGNKVHQ